MILQYPKYIIALCATYKKVHYYANILILKYALSVNTLLH